ncbi:hypothetical protein [Pseudomonas sp. EL_65y_Pfl2_R95]|uniref:hypothetical protein n=1 Tax=Pseudomonas sp. EL_65y_Pfl2_R95 TaxID=3088698 RepID=UPI0030DA812B
MSLYNLTPSDLFDPAKQLESEGLYEAQSEILFALAFSVPLGLPGASTTHALKPPTIHDKIVGVVAVIERFKQQFGRQESQPKTENRSRL